MQFVSFFVDPVWLSIDYGYNVTELQSPIVLMDYDTKIELLEKISELKYVGSISDKFGEALERAQTVKILYNLRVCK
jgi:calcium-activated chloride channel regulator 4